MRCSGVIELDPVFLKLFVLSRMTHNRAEAEVTDVTKVDDSRIVFICIGNQPARCIRQAYMVDGE